MYALKTKNKFEFCCISSSKDELTKKINNAFSNWLGMQARGSSKTIEDFLCRYDKVEIKIIPLEE